MHGRYLYLFSVILMIDFVVCFTLLSTSYETNAIVCHNVFGPYCKVRKNHMWQIYDIERHELVCDEWFEDVVPCGEAVYRLESQNGDKYMTIQWYYNRYDEEQSAVISNELPGKKEGK